jgi:annexin A7/11
MCGTTLVRTVQKEMSGWLGEGLEAMVTDHDRYYASVLFKSMDGVGTDEETLMRILTSRRHRLRGINDEFMQTYGKELRHRVDGECKGNFKNVLVGLCRDC